MLEAIASVLAWLIRGTIGRLTGRKTNLEQDAERSRLAVNDWIENHMLLLQLSLIVVCVLIAFVFYRHFSKQPDVLPVPLASTSKQVRPTEPESKPPLSSDKRPPSSPEALSPKPPQQELPRVPPANTSKQVPPTEPESKLRLPSDNRPPSAPEALSPKLPEPERQPVPSRPRDKQSLRLWKNATGKFQVMARLHSCSHGQVEMKREDGSMIQVPLETLSAEDQQFVASSPSNATITIDLSSGVLMEMVLIPAGEFDMGSPESDRNAQDKERPQHRVRISNPFYLGKCEVTQEQWQAVMGTNPSNCKGPRNPVERVTWGECQDFANKLTARYGSRGSKFHLPTEAQWEYACRARTKGEWCFGGADADLAEYAWFAGNSQGRSHRVGEKEPNAWGLYDVHGNVWEWCQDWYGPYDRNAPQEDPTGPLQGSSHVLRGGSLDAPAAHCRSAIRSTIQLGYRGANLGLRIALTSPGK